MSASVNNVGLFTVSLHQESQLLAARVRILKASDDAENLCILFVSCLQCESTEGRSYYCVTNSQRSSFNPKTRQENTTRSWSFKSLESTNIEVLFLGIYF